MAEIKKTNGHMVIDYMARDYGSLLQSMRGLIPDKLPDWTDYESEADFGNVLLQLFAHMGDILSYYQDRIANESFLGTAQTRRSIIHHLKLIGYRLSTATPASTTLTMTVPVSCNETVTIAKGSAFATKSEKNKPSVRFEYTAEQPLTINCSELQTDPVQNKKYFKPIPVEEGRLVEGEVLGFSDGTPNQKFSLMNQSLIMRSLGIGAQVNSDIILLTQLGDAIDTWELQESLAFSREDQQDYCIDIDDQDRATVIFGDGKFGAVPPSGAEIRATYRVGGGLKGNVVAKSIQTIVDAPQLALIGAKVINEKPATGGSERESIEHAVMHAPGVFRSLKRSITADDYKALALDFNGVGKVRAEATNWNTVALFVAPEGGGPVSDILKANLLAYFEDKRPLSTIIEIEDADYVKIYITADIGVESYYEPEAVEEKVCSTVADLLAFENVRFNDRIYLSKFYDKIMDIAGVRYVTIKQFTRKGEEEIEIEEDGIIELGVNEIPRIPDDDEDDEKYGRGLHIATLTGGVGGT